MEVSENDETHFGEISPLTDKLQMSLHRSSTQYKPMKTEEDNPYETR